MRGAAWSAPVVVLVAPVPAFAASPCVKSALQPVTWSTSRTTTSQLGTTTSGASVTVTGSYTATAVGAGSLNAANMTPSTVATANDSFSLANNSPTTLALDGSANYQTVTFGFTRPVYELTFFIDDIDRATGSYHDYVALTATPVETPTSTLGGAVTGSGTLADGWRTTAQQGDNATTQTVKVAYANGTTGMTSLSLRFWSPLLPAASAVHVVRIRQMQLRTCD